MKPQKAYRKGLGDGRKLLLHEKMKTRFISPAERFARCEGAAQSLGYKSIFSLALDNGISHQSTKASLNSPKMSLVRLEEFAVMLNCSVSFLTEQKIKGLK